MKAKVLFFVTMVFLPAFAFGGEKKSANVTLDQPVKVAGAQLAPGQYKVIWEGSGTAVTVSFVEGNKTIATAPARLVSTPTHQPVGIETDTSASHSQVLEAIYLKSVSIQFENAISGAGN